MPQRNPHLGIIMSEKHHEGHLVMARTLPKGSREKAIRRLTSPFRWMHRRNQLVDLNNGWYMLKVLNAVYFIYAPDGGITSERSQELTADDYLVAFTLPWPHEAQLVRIIKAFLPVVVWQYWYA